MCGAFPDDDEPVLDPSTQSKNVLAPFTRRPQESAPGVPQAVGALRARMLGGGQDLRRWRDTFVDRIGVVDTMFSCVNMGEIAEERLHLRRDCGERFEILRRTVPGFKDLGVAAKQMIETDGCRIVIACGMPGAAALDVACAHEASTGILLAQMLTSTHVLEVFVHMSEASDDAELDALCRNRVGDHADNAYKLLYAPEELRQRAGMGVRQGGRDRGPVAV